MLYVKGAEGSLVAVQDLIKMKNLNASAVSKSYVGLQTDRQTDVRFSKSQNNILRRCWVTTCSVCEEIECVV